MGKVKVHNEVMVYEIDGKEVSPRDYGAVVLGVGSHWSRGIMVRLKLQGVPVITVAGQDLKTAVDNALNAGH